MFKKNINALDLGSSILGCEGSTPFTRMQQKTSLFKR